MDSKGDAVLAATQHIAVGAFSRQIARSLTHALDISVRRTGRKEMAYYANAW